MLKRASLLAALLVVSACETLPPAEAPATKPMTPPSPAPSTPAPAPQTVPSIAGAPWLRPASFASLPGWTSRPLAPGLAALKRSCAKVLPRAEADALSNKAAWAGTVGEWKPACSALDVAADEASARTVFETLFTPLEVLSSDGRTKFTGYFEPKYEARRSPEGRFTEAVPALPPDFVANGDQPLQRLPDGTTRPYPARAEITSGPTAAIAYAHPSDVFFLQVQGSGRLLFPDGSTLRAAYAAHNGQPYKAAINWLLETGRISRGEASMQGIRAWMDRAGPEETRLFMNQNPRFVFFRALPEGDASLGPQGAQGIPLTPLGSMAVDPDIHALGTPLFVSTTAPGLGGSWSGLLIAQDTGGAIKGPVRGDLYFGTGFDAGERAGTMNAPGQMWVLLPKAVAARLTAQPGSTRPIAP